MAEDGVFLAFLQQTEHHDWGIFIDFRALAGSIMPGTYISSTGLSENRLWRPSDPLSAGSLGRNGGRSLSCNAKGEADPFKEPRAPLGVSKSPSSAPAVKLQAP